MILKALFQKAFKTIVRLSLFTTSHPQPPLLGAPVGAPTQKCGGTR